MHLDWSSSPHVPYVGQPATVTAKLSADSAANSELSMSREAGGDVAKIIPAPEGPEGDDSTADMDNDDYQIDPHAAYRRDLAAAKGATMLVESMANNHDLGGKGAERLGAPPSRTSTTGRVRGGHRPSTPSSPRRPRRPCGARHRRRRHISARGI